MMLVQGATMTASWGAERVIVRDNRYKAVVGYVPFFGLQPSRCSVTAIRASNAYVCPIWALAARLTS